MVIKTIFEVIVAIFLFFIGLGVVFLPFWLLFPPEESTKLQKKEEIRAKIFIVLGVFIFLNSIIWTDFLIGWFG